MPATLRGVVCAGFPVARGAHYVPGLDAYLRFAAPAPGKVAMAWASVHVVVPSTLQAGPDTAP